MKIFNGLDKLFRIKIASFSEKQIGIAFALFIKKYFRIIQTVEISITNNSILNQAATTYNNFEGCKIPFAAIKLNICLQNTSEKEIDEIVEHNFRSEKDLIFKQDKNYIILMKHTTIEAAEMAVNRLKPGVGQIMARNCENLKNGKHVRASAYILGSSRGTKRIRLKYLDLKPTLNSFQRSFYKMPLDYREYLRWLELPKNERLEINKIMPYKKRF